MSLLTRQKDDFLDADSFFNLPEGDQPELDD